MNFPLIMFSLLVLCGAISQYADMDAVTGPSNYLQLIAQSARMQGFTMRDYLKRIPEAVMQLLQWSATGEVRFREHVVDGIGSFPQAFPMLFRGENRGKLLLRVRDDAGNLLSPILPEEVRP